MPRSTASAALAAALLLALACGDRVRVEEAQAPPPASEPSEASPADAPASADPAEPVVVPAAEGSWDAMWGPLRELPTLHRVVRARDVEGPLARAIEEGSVPADEMPVASMYVQPSGAPEGVRALAVYTDPALVEPGTHMVEEPTEDLLHGALFDLGAEAVSFNPSTPFSRRQVFSYAVDRLYLARLVGYLRADPAGDAAGGHCARANAAHAGDRPFVALYHAIRAQEEGEDWTACEVAKLAALAEIGFPGARPMAREELEWFVSKHGASPETEALRAALDGAAPDA